MDVTQFDASGPDSEPRIGEINGNGLLYLKV